MGNHVSVFRVAAAALVAPGSDGVSAADLLARGLEEDGDFDEALVGGLPGAIAFEGWDGGSSELPATLGSLAERAGPTVRFLRHRADRQDWAAHLSRLPPGLHRLALNPTIIVLAAEELHALRATAASQPEEEWTRTFDNLATAPEDGSVDLLFMFGGGGPPLTLEAFPESSPQTPWPKPLPPPARPPSAFEAEPFQRGAVALLVLFVALVVPAVLYSRTSAEDFPVVLGGLTFFWLLFSLVEFRNLRGVVVSWPRRLLLFVGGELAMALLHRLIHLFA